MSIMSNSERVIDLVEMHPLLVLAAFFLIYVACLYTYRLTLHPLAKFPGPRLAAATVWYEFYYDGIKGGLYTFEIAKMHEKYGPIVRISPEELHVNDPAFIDELYAGSAKPRDKYGYYSSQFGIPESGFGTVGHQMHRMRRGALQRFFSKASVTKLEPIIHEAIEKLCSQLKTYIHSDSPVALNQAFSCMTTDIVTEYAFAKSSKFLDSPTFEPNFHDAIVAGTNLGIFIKQFPWLFPVMKSLPDSMVSKMNPEMSIYLRFQQDTQALIRDIQSQGRDKRLLNTRTHTTIFHELLDGDLPDSEKSADRLWQEGQITIGAGTETTAWGLCATMFYILNDPAVLSKLRAELAHAIPDQNSRPPCSLLEQLPYLSAVVQEGLRLTYGVSTRLQRVNPLGPLHFRSTVRSASGSEQELAYEIPAGTPVGMTSVLIHNNPDLFPDPTSFRPERWLDANGNKHKLLDKYMLSFSKGTRQCLGINLAYAELYMGLGLVVRRLGTQLQLFETDKSDVEIHYDRFVPVPKDGTKGIRVLVTKPQMVVAS